MPSLKHTLSDLVAKNLPLDKAHSTIASDGKFKVVQQAIIPQKIDVVECVEQTQDIVEVCEVPTKEEIVEQEITSEILEIAESKSEVLEQELTQTPTDEVVIIPLQVEENIEVDDNEQKKNKRGRKKQNATK